MFLSAILSVLGLGFMVYVLFALAVYALPFFVAVTVGIHVYDSEAGLLAAFAAGFVSGAVTLLAGQIAFATIRSAPIKLAIGALYAAPAGIAGYHAIKGLSEIGGAGETWTLVFAWIGAVIVGGAAWGRIALLAGPNEDIPAEPAGFSSVRAANDG
jgi:hypothetical protein